MSAHPRKFLGVLFILGAGSGVSPVEILYNPSCILMNFLSHLPSSVKDNL